MNSSKSPLEEEERPSRRVFLANPLEDSPAGTQTVPLSRPEEFPETVEELGDYQKKPQSVQHLVGWHHQQKSLRIPRRSAFQNKCVWTLFLCFPSLPSSSFSSVDTLRRTSCWPSLPLSIVRLCHCGGHKGTKQRQRRRRRSGGRGCLLSVVQLDSPEK